MTVGFFETLDTHASNLNKMVEEAQDTNEQKSFQLWKAILRNVFSMKKSNYWIKLQKCWRVPMLEKKLVQVTVHELRECMNSKTMAFRKEISTMQGSNSCIKAEWINHMERIESHYIENQAKCESRGSTMEECPTIFALIVLLLWISIVRHGIEANRRLLTRFSFAFLNTLEDVDAATNGHHFHRSFITNG